jgi:DNA-binding SARP family transcriptional activator
MPPLQIRILGRFSAQLSGHMLGGIDPGKMQSLLCFLLLHRDRPQSCEALASRFWDDTGMGQAKRQLQHMIWHLQVALGDEETPARDRVLLVESDWVSINPRAELWLDVAEFERAFEMVRGKHGETLDADMWQGLQRTVALYRGALLEGCYEEWCLLERERIEGMMVTMLEKLMDYCDVHALYELGAEYGERILLHDRANERVYRKLMRIHYLNGDRAAATRQYERCKAALLEQLNVEPAMDTRILYERIKADHLDEDPASVLAPTPARTRNSAVPPVQVAIEQSEYSAGQGSLFEELEARFATLQGQVSETIRVLRETHKMEYPSPQDVRGRDTWR